MANEKRLIDANALLAKRFTAGLSDASGNDYGYADVVLVDDIENAPTVDAAEVVHGRWILEAHEEIPNCKWSATAECSECEENGKIYEMYISGFPAEKAKEIVLREAREKTKNYCPNCGAKMDGGNEDANTD